MKFTTIKNWMIAVIVCASTSVWAMNIPVFDGISNEAIWQGIERRCALESARPNSSSFAQQLEDLATGVRPELQIINLVVLDSYGQLRKVDVVLYGLNQVAAKNSFSK